MFVKFDGKKIVLIAGVQLSVDVYTFLALYLMRTLSQI